MSGGGNCSGYNNCNLEFKLTLQQLQNLENLEIEIEEIEESIEDYPEDPIEIGTGSDGTDFFDIIGEIKDKGYTDKDYVMVMRTIICPEDEEKGFYVNEREVLCTNQSLEKLNKTYYLHGEPFPNGSSKNDLSPLSDNDIKRVQEEDGFYPHEGSYFGYDLYELNNFDLEKELSTHYGNYDK